ncbi:MAG: HpcH/HpaI aldolase/citrate lyase family protein [Melioribacteraceae bacterium]|nr:HpcH/HpaI aldolase/citrate lyase family protein [Melioribacteraceae bacterium]
MAQIKKASAGKLGDQVRSDCFIEIELKQSGGLNIDLKSKVEVMFGDQIRSLIEKMCTFFEIDNAVISITDYGALEYVIMARFELAVKKLFPDCEKEFLPEFSAKNKYKTVKERLRRSRLYLPGNEPKFYPNAGLHKPDAVILDLEDSVSHTEKDAAQLIVRNALRVVDFYGSERMVRINQLPLGLDDLKYIVPNNVHIILIPKVETAEQIIEIHDEVNRLKKVYKVNNEIYFMPIIESALGIINSYQIAKASDKNCALAIGLEDYTADIGVQRTNEGKESIFARSILINSAKAAGIQAIDTVFSDVADMEGLRESVIEAKSLGFEGKGCIHPRQVPIVNAAFAPTEKEIERAKKIVMSFEEAEKKGIGVVSLGSKMIDAPVVKRALHTIDVALLNGILDKDWRREL